MFVRAIQRLPLFVSKARKDCADLYETSEVLRATACQDSSACSVAISTHPSPARTNSEALFPLIAPYTFS